MEKPRIRMSAEFSTSSSSEPEYHGASSGRRFVGYGRSGSGPNASLENSLVSLRNRSRHAFRNSPLVKSGFRKNVTNTVGKGMTPRFRSEDKEYNDALRTAFNLFSNECDPQGVLNIYGIQALIDLSRRMSGECFIRRRRRTLNYGLAVPMQLQVLESDFVPIGENKTRPNGNKIKNGIEFNKRGKRVAYWMYKEHPGEYNFGEDNSILIRVRAEDVIHVFKPDRPGQIRGEPESSTSLLKVKTFDSYDDAELQRKETRSAYTGMLTRQEYDDQDYMFDPFTGKNIYDEGSPEEASIQPGTFITGLPGESLTLFDGDNTGGGYKDFAHEQKLMIAAGLNIPVELMSGDWTKINDRIYRALIEEYRRGVQMDQHHILVHQAMRVIGDWFIEAAILAGLVKPSNYLNNKADFHNIEWRAHSWKYINPLQDIQAHVLAKDNDLQSGDAIVAESGQDPEEVDKQNIEAELRRKELREEAGLSASVEDEDDPPDQEEEDDPDEEDEEEVNEPQ